MLRPTALPALLLAALLLAALPAAAQEAAEAKAEAPAADGILSLLPDDSVTEHTVGTPAGPLAYTATAGTLALRDGAGKQVASLFYTAYAAEAGAGEDRPVTFVFNGGPGAASAYLHLGLVGPRVAAFGDPPAGPPAGPPDGAAARLADNPATWLRFTDLVAVDPVGTGWSRAATAKDARQFWSVGADARWLAKAVALWLAENGRTGAPVWLLGESYGGFRAAKLARALQDEQGIVAAGIVMVSPFLDGALQPSGGGGAGGSALNAALLLPSIAAAELERRGEFSEAALAEAERFAMTDYLVALAGRPPEPQAEAGRAFYDRLAAMTGLPAETVARRRGFVTGAYLEAARAREGAVRSHYDAAFAAPDPFPESTRDRAPDPVLDGFAAALGGLFSGYARGELGFETEVTYRLLNGEVSRRWDWEGGQQTASAERELREMLALNPGFRLLVAHGRSDIVTPYGISRYILDHLPDAVAGRARLETYRGGHMFYFDRDARAAFTQAAEAFYRGKKPSP